MASPIVLRVTSDVREAQRGLRTVSAETEAMSQKSGKSFARIKRLAAAGVAAIAVGAVALAGASVKAASEAEQSIGATETVFGKFAGSVIRDSKAAAKQFGLSANEYRENANLLGSLFKNQGVSLDALGGKTKAMIGVAADLSATFGGSTKEAVEALGSAFKGEFDPLERYGISLKQSTVNTEAMRLANVKSEAAFKKLSTAQQTTLKQQAASTIIAQQSADAAGAFGRESDTLAHKQQVLAAQVENVKAKLGNFLLPIISEVAGFVSDKVVPAVEKFVNQMRNGNGAGGEFAQSLKDLRDDLIKAWEALRPVVEFLIEHPGAVLAMAAAIKAVSAAVKAWRTIQLLLNIALAANPIGLVITAIALLVAGIVIAYKKSETFRSIVTGALDAISSAFRWFWNNVGYPIIKFFLDGLNKITIFFAALVTAMSKVPGFGWLKPLAEDMRNAAEKTQALTDSIQKIPARKTVNVDVRVNTTQIDKVQNQIDRLGGGNAGLVRGRTTSGGSALTLLPAATTTTVEVRLTAEQVTTLESGRELLIQIDTAEQFGVRRRAS